VIKGGKTEEGARAAQSHTGSLAGRDEIFEALFRQAGAIRVSDFEELLDFGKTFAYQPLPQDNRTAIVTLSGGAGVMATDICLESGLRLARLEARTLEKLKEKMPSWAHPGNPFDIEPLSEIVTQEGAYRLGLDTVLSDPGVDLALLVMSTLKTPHAHADYLLEVTRAHPEKPVAVCIIGEADGYKQLFQIMEEASIPVFVSVRRAVASLAALHRYRRFLDSLK
jgi:acetyltransferase